MVIMEVSICPANCALHEADLVCTHICIVRVIWDNFRENATITL